MPTSFRLFPESASTMADQVDRLFYFLVAVSGSFTLIILVLIVYFALKYRRRSDTEIPPKTVPNYKLEITWTVVPLVLAMVMFVWGASLYVKMFTPPPTRWKSTSSASSGCGRSSIPRGGARSTTCTCRSAGRSS